jgi:hypothetical protein
MSEQQPAVGPDEQFMIESLPFDPSADPAPVLARVPNRGGVFWLAAADGAEVLMDTAGRLRQRLAGYLAPDAHDGPSKRANLRSVCRTVHFVTGDSPFEINLLFGHIARRHYPQTYRELFRYRDAWFVKVNPAARVGRFQRSNKLFIDRCRYFGPLPDKHAAARYVERIEETFKLCRCEEAYRPGRRAEHCLLYDMGKCLGLGVGAVDEQAYRRVVAEAADFAADRGRAHRTDLEAQMKQAAAGRRFEQASALKGRLEKLGALDARKFAWVADARTWRMLIVQPAAGRGLVRPFVFTAGAIQRWAPVRWKEFATAAEPLLAACRRKTARPPDAAARRLVADGFALLAFHLFNRKGDRGLYLPIEADTTADSLAAAVTARFSPKRRKPRASTKPDVHHPDRAPEPRP